jgi:hypothetical protein
MKAEEEFTIVAKILAFVRSDRRGFLNKEWINNRLVIKLDDEQI